MKAQCKESDPYEICAKAKKSNFSGTNDLDTHDYRTFMHMDAYMLLGLQADNAEFSHVVGSVYYGLQYNIFERFILR